MTCAAARQVRLERALKADDLGDARLLEILGEIERTVEDERADAVGVHVGVDRTDGGAIGVPHVGQLVLAEGHADGLHVARDILRAEVGEQVGVLVCAVIRELLGDILDLLPFGRVVGRRVGRDELLQVGMARDGRALADAARVKRDQVEAVADVAGDDAGPVLHEVDRRAAGAAGIREERADALPLVLRGEADERQAERRAGGIGVVDGDGECGALEAARLAGLPGEARLGRGGVWRLRYGCVAPTTDRDQHHADRYNEQEDAAHQEERSRLPR